MWTYCDFNTELYHHGVKGMKWGVRRSPQQLGHPAPKKRKGSVGKAIKKAGSAIVRGGGKVGSATASGLKAAKKKGHEANAERIIRSGDPDKIYKNRNRLTDQELNRAVKRVGDNQKLYESNLKIKELKRSPASRFVQEGGKSVGHTIEKKGLEILGVAVAGGLAYAGWKYMQNKHPELAPHMFPGANKIEKAKNNVKPEKTSGSATWKTGNYVHKSLAGGRNSGEAIIKKVANTTVKDASTSWHAHSHRELEPEDYDLSLPREGFRIIANGKKTNIATKHIASHYKYDTGMSGINIFDRSYLKKDIGRISRTPDYVGIRGTEGGRRKDRSKVVKGTMKRLKKKKG